MSSRLNPYLSFQGNAREAMEFYRSVLGGELSVMTFGDMREEGEHKDQVMHSYLRTDAGYELMGADAPPGMEGGAPGGAVCISGEGEDDLIRRYWSGLSEGAQVMVPLEKQPWGDEFGQLVDRFGVTWMVDFGDAQTDAAAAAG